MERLIDITNFFIVKPTHLDTIINSLNLNLTNSDPNYLSTLIIANIFAVIVIFLFIKCVRIVLKKLFRKRRGFTIGGRY